MNVFNMTCDSAAFFLPQCDYDSDCQGDLVCFQRHYNDPIPCCPHIGTGGKTDFCAPPTKCKLQMCESDVS